MLEILVVGAGAMGSFYAAALAMAGERVRLIARGARLAVIREQGILLERADATVRIDVPALERPVDGQRADLVLLCTKMGDLAGALDLMTPLRAGRPAFVTVQNGVDAPEIVASRFPGAPVVAARAHGFFELQGAHVRHVGVEPSLVLGLAAGELAPDGRGDLLGRFAATLQAAGIVSRVSDDIRRELWEKLLLAGSVGGVATALGINTGQVCDSAGGREMLAAVMREVGLVAAARGVALSPGCMERTLDFVASFPPDARSSLQRDLEEGRTSEYASLNGTVLRMAGEAGVAVPAHLRVDAAIRTRGLL
jgi:2-dehydropantoate 2-reductase